MKPRAILAAAGLWAVAASIPMPAAAQVILSDYESQDAARQARANAIWRLAFRPARQVMSQTVAVLRKNAALSPADAAAVDDLLEKAKSATDIEARRLLWHAVSISLGQRWTPVQEALCALAIKPSHTVTTGKQSSVELALQYPVELSSDTQFSIELVAGVPTNSATPKRGPHVRRLATGKLTGTSPQIVPVDFQGIADGFYILTMRVTGGDGSSSELAAPIYLQPHLRSRGKAVKAIVDRIKGHEEARAAALYPFELADAINKGTREVISYDFNRAVTRAQEITGALGRGKDVVYRSVGLQDRAYRFAETGELVPYQLYVPKNWTPYRKWPLVVALHGANLDETNMLGRANGRMQALAEEQGFVVVAPLGYRINSAYGITRGLSKLLGADDDRVRRSEADVLAVTGLVSAEYNIDPARTYLTGNSMGGAGTWWIAARHPERWAAIAPAAFGGVTAEDVAALSTIPILAVVGAKDELGMRDAVKESVDILRANSVKANYLEIPDGTHASGFDEAMDAIFNFFSAHRK